MLPTVVIAGRPNVGKSTLFNRLVGRRHAIVSDTPGVTRDHKDAEAQLRGRMVRLVDTAGLEESAPDSLYGRMRASSETAVAGADLVVFVVDARAGITPADNHFAAWLRRQNRPVLVVANKAEGRGGANAALEAFSLGLGEPLAVSAEHGDGIADLMSEIADRIPPERDAEDDEAAGRPLKLAIVGRPNAGKSTLLNRLLGQERMITGPEPGLTRDSVAVMLQDSVGAVELVDTAGLRKRARRR
jgi:GTP-binding protein